MLDWVKLICWCATRLPRSPTRWSAEAGSASLLCGLALQTSATGYRLRQGGGSWRRISTYAMRQAHLQFSRMCARKRCDVVWSSVMTETVWCCACVHAATPASRDVLCCVSGPPFDAGVRQLFTEGAADPLIPQSNDPACTSPLCDIRRQCELMSNTSIGTAYERLVELNRVARGGECLAADYQAMLAQLVNPSLAPDRTDRVWFYQTCTEFGFYQTCDADSDCASYTSLRRTA